MKSISGRIIRSNVITSVTMAITAMVVVILLLSKTYLSQGENALVQSAQLIGKEIDEVMNSAVNYVETVAGYTVETLDVRSLQKDETYGEEYCNTIAPFLLNMVENYEQALGIAFFINPELTETAYQVIYERTDTESEFQKLTKFSKEEFYESNPDMSWYYTPIINQQGVWSDPHTDGFSDSMRFSYTIPIYSGSQLLGVVALDLFFDEYKSLIQDYTVYDTGYAFLVNQDLDYIVNHPDNEDTSAKEAFGSILSGNSENSGFDLTKYGDKKVVVSYYTLMNGNTVGIVVLQSELMQIFLDTLYIAGGITLVLLLITIGVAFLTGRRISKPIVKITQLVDQTAQLDFTEIDTYDKLKENRDETGKIAESVLLVREILRGVFGDIKGHMQSTVSSSNLVMDTAANLAQSAKEINQVSMELAEGSTHQAQEATYGTQQLKSLDESIDKAIIIGDRIQDTFEVVKDANQAGIGELNELSDKMKVVSQNGLETSNRVNELSEKSNAIANIIQTIQSIAEQINLLSLNASIEAARAGEAGKGFVVVAQEVRTLSDATAEAVQEIEKIVYNIVDEVEATQSNVVQSQSAIEEANKAMNSTRKKLYAMDEAFIGMGQEVRELANDLRNVQNVKSDVLESIEGISAICEQTAAATQQVAATIESQLSDIQNLSMITQELTGEVNNLEEEVNQFKI